MKELIGGLFLGGLLASAFFGLIGLSLIGIGIIILIGHTLHIHKQQQNPYSYYPPYRY